MTKYKIWLVSLVLAFGALTPQLAQEVSKGAEAASQQSSVHDLMVGLVRTINTIEVSYYSQHGSYASWQTLVENPEVQQYLNDWLARFHPQAAKNNFGTPPEVLPGLNLRLNIAPDGRSYIVFVEDASDKDGFAFVSDERGVIRYCRFIR